MAASTVASSSLGDRGVLVAPGSFYGTEGHRHVRVALTATDERVAAAGERLAASRPASAPWFNPFTGCPH